MCADKSTLQHVCKTSDQRKPSELSESMETKEPCESSNNMNIIPPDCET